MADKKLRVIDESGGKELANAVNTLAGIVESLAETVKKIQNDILNELPVITPEMKKDNKVYALVNGKYEDICPEDANIVIQSTTSAAQGNLEGPNIMMDIPYEEIPIVKPTNEEEEQS